MTKLPLLLAALCALLLTSCTSVSSPGTVTPGKELAAKGVRQVIQIGLAPVLAHNPSYANAASGVAVAIDSFSGDDLTPASVDAILAKTSLDAEASKVTASLINSAWSIYVEDYRQAAGGAVRPDVKLFLSAVSRGVLGAAAAVPKN